MTEVFSAIKRMLSKKYIYLPRNKNKMRQKVSEFELIFGMIQDFGSTDRTHIALKRPPENSQDFLNYKYFFSFNFQAVCDTNGYFMDMECKWLCIVHDAKVFENLSV